MTEREREIERERERERHTDIEMEGWNKYALWRFSELEHAPFLPILVLSI